MKVLKKTIIIDLKDTEEEILKKIHKNARWGIKRAKKEGLIIEENKHLNKFYPIYLKEMKRYKVTPYSFENIDKNKLVFIGCLKNNKLIAGIVMILDSKTNLPRIEYHASLEEYHKFQPNDLLYWSCIVWAKKKGYKKLDLGGHAVNPKGNMKGVNRYKEKWGKIFSEEINVSLLEWIKFNLMVRSKFCLKIILELKFLRNNLKGLYNIKNKYLEKK